MTPQEFEAVYPLVHSWIRETLASHSGVAKPVSSRGFARLPNYFSAELLASTKFVTVDRVPMPPLSKMGLGMFAQFESGDFDGITYLDTFFVKHGRAAEERLYFHELIHVVQWQLLGPEVFLATYAAGLEKLGYRDSPLEATAYGAEAAFVPSSNIFNAENVVAAAPHRGAGAVNAMTGFKAKAITLAFGGGLSRVRRLTFVSISQSSRTC